MVNPRGPPRLPWARSQADALHLVAEVNSPSGRNRGTTLPKIATGRSAQSAKRLWKDYEKIEIRSSIQQTLENPDEHTVFGRVPKNPKGLYNKPVNDPKPFHLLHHQSSIVTKRDRELNQLYSQMAFLANAVRNTDGTTSYKNLCMNPDLNEGGPRNELERGTNSESLRWSSASMRRPTPRLLLPLKPGSSTQWYSWKVDTPRGESRKKKRKSNRDGIKSFRQQFSDDVGDEPSSANNYGETNSGEILASLKVRREEKKNEKEEEEEEGEPLKGAEVQDESSESRDKEYSEDVEEKNLISNGAAVKIEMFITQVVDDGETCTEKRDISSQGKLRSTEEKLPSKEHTEEGSSISLMNHNNKPNVDENGNITGPVSTETCNTAVAGTTDGALQENHASEVDEVIAEQSGYAGAVKSNASSEEVEITTGETLDHEAAAMQTNSPEDLHFEGNLKKPPGSAGGNTNTSDERIKNETFDEIHVNHKEHST